MSIRKRVYDILDPGHHQGLLSKTANYVIYSLIFLSVGVIVLDSVPSICQRCSTGFRNFEVLTVIVFKFAVPSMAVVSGSHRDFEMPGWTTAIS